MEKHLYIQKIEEIAKKNGVKKFAHDKWKSRGHVPHKWRLPILQAAQKEGVEIPLEVFDNYRSVKS